MTETKRRYLFFFLSLSLVGIIYCPVIGKSFLSDDFEVMRRNVFSPNGILIKGFFRPLSDITLYSNYLVAGFDPVVYNLFNLAAHACIVFMVYLIAKRITWVPETNRSFFSCLSALLFLTYPFHNESVIWGVGRASLMAGLFGVMAMLAAVSDIRPRRKYLLVSLYYFIGLSGYESVLVLPGIILLLVYDRKLSLRSYMPWVIWLSATLVIHLVVRVLVSGVLVGKYGTDSLTPEKSSFVMKCLKVLGRVFLPPMEQSMLLVGLSFALALLLAGCIYLLWREKNDGSGRFSGVARLSGMLLLSMLVPLAFGVSTRTYEGDRLFYFPSVFTAMWLAWLITALLKGRWALVVAGVVLLYQSAFLAINICNWRRASDITTDIISTIQNRPRPSRKIMVVNVPEEYNGAYILRNGFYDALWLRGVDTSKVRAVNYITTEQMRFLPPLIRPQHQNGRLQIAPDATIMYSDVPTWVSGGKRTGYLLQADTLDTDIYYWNKEKLIPLQ